MFACHHEKNELFFNKVLANKLEIISVLNMHDDESNLAGRVIISKVLNCFKKLQKWTFHGNLINDSLSMTNYFSMACLLSLLFFRHFFCLPSNVSVSGPVFFQRNTNGSWLLCCTFQLVLFIFNQIYCIDNKLGH